MRWTPELLAKLQTAADEQQTVAEAAKTLHLTREQIVHAARYYKIGLNVRHPTITRVPKPTPEAELRERWQRLIPKLKANLVQELELVNGSASP